MTCLKHLDHSWILVRQNGRTRYTRMVPLLLLESTFFLLLLMHMPASPPRWAIFPHQMFAIPGGKGSWESSFLHQIQNGRFLFPQWTPVEELRTIMMDKFLAESIHSSLTSCFPNLKIFISSIRRFCRSKHPQRCGYFDARSDVPLLIHWIVLLGKHFCVF